MILPNKRQVKASQEYENLLAYNSTTGAARDLKNALILIKDIFTTIHKDYVIGGALALGFYAKPRSTNDVDVFTHLSSKSKILAELDRRDIKYTKESNSQYIIPATATRSDFDILLGLDDSFEELMFKPNKGLLYGVEVPITRPEGLLWNYLISITDNLDKAKQLQHKADAANLLRSGKVNTRHLRQELEATDFTLIDLLDELIDAARSPKGSYAKTLELRANRLGQNR